MFGLDRLYGERPEPLNSLGFVGGEVVLAGNQRADMGTLV